MKKTDYKTKAWRLSRGIINVVAFLILWTTISFGQTTVTLTPGQTWTVPAGVTSATFYLWGGGGAGEGNSTAPACFHNGGGGGGGACVSAVVSTLSSGQVYTFTGGAGGVGNSGGAAGGNGGTTTFSGTAGTWTAAGGTGATATISSTGSLNPGGAGGATGSGPGFTVRVGGNGSAGYNGTCTGDYAGSGGGGGGSTGNGTSAVNGCPVTPGVGGSGTFPGGNGASTPNCGVAGANQAGVAGSPFGGGGSGVINWSPLTLVGGAGGQGRVVVVFTPAACSGTPTGGTTISSANPVCSGVNFTLSLSGASAIGGGITYQWQSADDAAFTVNLANLGTAATQITNQTASKYYRCKVTCTNSGLFINSTPLQVTMGDFATCGSYCTPVFTNFDGTDYVAQVICNTINNITGNTPLPGYTSYVSSINTSLQAGNTYSVTVKSGGFADNFAVWIDFNQNGTFDAAPEKIGETAALAAGASATYNFTVPVGATVGATRMRVIASNNAIPVLPCTASGYGEAEDYKIIITAPVILTPTISSFTPSSGCSNTLVTITGTNFGGATAVQFGGVNALSFTVVSSTTITANPPASGGLVSVTNPAGTATSGSSFTFSAPAAPTSTTALPATICQGQSSNLNAISAGNNINWWTSSTGGTYLGSSASGANFSVTPASAGVNNYYAETTTGIIPVGNILNSPVHSTTGSGNFTLGYSFTPNVNLTVTAVRSYWGNKVSIWTDAGTLLASQAVVSTNGTWTQTALASPITLTAGVTYRIAAYSNSGSYYWHTTLPSTFANGTINQGYEISGDAFPTTTDAPKWWFVDLAYGSTGCASATRTPVAVNVNTAPTVTFNQSPSSFCAGSNAVLTALPNGATSYAWSTGATTQSITINSAGTYTATVTSGGCPGTASIIVTSKPAPVATASATPNPICPGGSIALNATGTPGSLGSYSVNSIPYNALTPSGTPSVLCTGGTNNSTGNYTSSGSLDDGYWDNIALPFTFNYYGVSNSTIRIATNGNVQFGTAVAGGQPGSYSWVPQTIPTAGGNLDNFIGLPWMDHDPGTTPFGVIRYFTNGVSPNRKFVVSFEAVKVFNISDLNTGQIILNEADNSIEIHLGGGGLAASTVNKAMGIEGPGGLNGTPAPGRNFGTWSTVANEAWKFTNDAAAITGYSWSGPNLYSSTSQNNTLSNVQAVNAGMYTVTVTDANGCTGTGNVTVSLNAAPELTADGGEFCAGTTISLIADNIADGQSSGNTYQWSGPNSYSSTQQNPSIANANGALHNGIYTVTVTNSTLCTATTTVTVNVNPNPTFSTSNVVDEGCPGAADGSFLATASGGTAPYDYSIDAGVTSNQSGSFTGLTQATYTVQVISDNNGCMSAPATVVINSPNSPPTVTCPGNQTANTSGACTAVVTYSTSSTGTPAPTITYAFTGATTASGSGDGSGSAFNVGVTTVTVTATNSCGSQNCSFTVTVTDAENPVITCPANIAVCDPGSPVVTFSVGATDNCSILSVVSTPASGSTFPPGTTTVNSTATDVNGNTASCSFTVTVSSPSTAPTSATTNAPLNNICTGNSVILTANGGSLGTGASYQWYSGTCGGTPAGTGASITLSPTVTTTYFVRAEGACNTTTCASVTVTVSTAPVTSLAIMPFTGMPANVCNGTVATLSIAPVTRATFYVWDVPTGSYFNGNPLNVSPFTTATPSVTVTFGNPSGSLYAIGVQAGNACGLSTRQSQKVRGLTSVPANVSGPLTACASTAGSYTTTAVTGATSYLWSITGDATVTGTGTTGAVTFGPSWTGGTLCVAAQTTCYTSPTKCITIGTSAATLGSISGTFTACPNSTLTYSVPASAGAASYTWTLPPGATGSSTTNSINVTFGPGYNAVGSICVSVTSICGVTSAVKCKTVAPGLPSVPSSIGGPTNGLCGQSVVFTCPSQGGGVTYTWTVPAGATIVSGQGSTSVNVTFGTFTTGSVCVKANNACGSSATRCITVKGSPATPGAITADPTSWCANDEGITFTVNVAGLSGAYTLNWTYPTSPVATYQLGGGNSTSLLMNWGTGTGNINVTASNACGSGTKTSTWSNTCREGGVATVSSMTVSPNPTTGIINVNYTAQKGNTVITVLDLAGRVVMTENATSVDGANNTQLDMSKLAKGAYMLSVQTAEGNKQVKVVVE